MPEQNDALTIERSLAEPRLFELIFDRHFDAVFRFVCRRVGQVRAEDVCAETFALAFSQRDRYDMGFPDARPWLYGIATNLLRRLRRDEERELRAYARTGVDPLSRWDSVLAGIRSSLEREVAATLSALDPGDRDALLLLAWGDLRYEEIAIALSIPVGTAKSRVHRARAQLRVALAPSMEAYAEAADG
jgi:RNA polymerase sigma-70 factor (ECF subfamily)